MRYLAAYLLLQIGGNASPSAADIKKVLGAVGIESDDARLDTLISELQDKSINDVNYLHSYSLASLLICSYHYQLIAEGSSKLASVSLVQRWMSSL